MNPARRPPTAAIVAILVLAVARAAGAAGDAVPLEWKWTKGDSLRYRLTQEQRKTTAEAPEGPVQTQWIVFRQDVRDVAADGTASIAATYEAVKLDASDGANALKYDSTDPKDAPKAEIPTVKPLAALVGHTVSYRIDRAGKVSEVAGFDELVARVMAGMEQHPMAPTLAAMFKKTFGNEAMDKQLEDQFGVVPGRPAKPGDAWEVSVEQDVPNLGVLVIDHRYSLRSVEPVEDGSRARIAVDSAMSVTGSASAPIRLREGRATGEILFDAGRGRVVRRDVTVAMDFEIDLGPRRTPGKPPPTGTAEPRALMGQKVEQKSTLELLAKDAPPF